MSGLRSIPGRGVALVGLALWVVVEVVRASAQVARDIVAPTPGLASVILVVPLRTRTPLETAVVSGLITLTPGTLTVAVHEEPRVLWVHGLYGADPEQLRADLVRLEGRVLRAMRHPERLEEDR